MRYEFTQYETDVYGGETGDKITTSFHADSIDQVLEKMHYFLKGSGFIFNGQLDIVPEDNSDLETFKINVDNDDDITVRLSDYDNMGGGGTSSDHSPYYYDFDRNRPVSTFSLDDAQMELDLNLSIDPITLGNVDTHPFVFTGDDMHRNYYG